MYFTAELEENSTLNSKVWEAAGLHSNGTFPLDYFSYNNSALLDVIFRHLEKTNFNGITVSMYVCSCILVITVVVPTEEHEVKSVVTDLLTIIAILPVFIKIHAHTRQYIHANPLYCSCDTGSCLIQ